MASQVEQVIEALFNPHSDQRIKDEAYIFLTRLRDDRDAWQVCLSLFTKTPAPGEVVRLVCLEIVNNAVQTQQLNQQSLVYVRDSLLAYIRQWYTSGSTNLDTAGIQNKLTQTITYLFTALYASEWSSFFDDFRALAGDAANIGTSNPTATVMYLRIIGSVHDEIADQMIPRTPDELKRHNDLKDIIRGKDVGKIAVTWQEILSRWRQIDLGITEMCLRTIAKWVSWIDINLVLDQTVQSALLELAGQQGSFTSESKEARARDAAIDTFTETVGKKMPAGDKIELIRYLNLEAIVGQLLASQALSQMRNTADYDTDLAETVAKLVNNIIVDVVKVLDSDGVEAGTRDKAERLLQVFMPHMLRLFSDEYDEICSVVIPSLTDLLTMLRKNVKLKDVLPSSYSGMLQPVLDAIIAKTKYDETASPENDDDADEEEFQELRKKLHVLQQTVAAISETLYVDTLTRLIAHTFTQLDAGDKSITWRDVDLAMHEMYHFGELATKNGGMYAKSAPSSVASQRLLEMMARMVEADLANYPHSAIQLQYMEICVRYVTFFEHNADSIPRVLENFVRFMHSDNTKVKLRSWYLFQRFIRHLRAKLGNVAQTVMQAISDLLVIKAELPEARDDEDVSSDDEGQSARAAFDSQLFLYEAIGTVSSTATVPVEQKVAIVRSMLEPLTRELQQHIPTAMRGDGRAALQVHHVIMASGSLAYGFSDWTPGQDRAGQPPVPEVTAEFITISEATLTALESLKHNFDIRNAARNAFSRYLGVLGSRVLSQLPRWIDGLLSSASSNDEMAMFLRTLGQVVYGFKTEISGILDQLLSPLLQQVMSGLSAPVTGTDDEVQMRELKQQYLNFVLVILNNDLASVLISSANQASFDSFVSTLTRFAVDPSDPQSARLAFSALAKLVSLWGGPDIEPTGTPYPILPGFDSFITTSFASLPWTLLSGGGFNPHDAQMRSVLQEAASLQYIMLRKLGNGYRAMLESDLGAMGAGPEAVAAYLTAIAKPDQFGFRKFFAQFVQGAKR
ncbi:hypothetical protein LTR62_005333 [Meristemomyces frigidus]|uniref:Exportin-T n=1 Tax=Meristemomyces frigidus TaxID=1508187 RepID=A0AAN7TL61_9PEZI|nr:hypothetical protein LTR62_005333 [Meristemomyces frigidus]